MNRVNDLIEELMSNPDCRESGVTANRLLAEYQRGAPVESLRRLLQSADDRVVSVGAWIASELSDEGKSLLSDACELLTHPSKHVRFYSIDCVHCWAGATNSEALASAVALVNDTEKAVRWKAMTFLALASREQLQAAVARFTAVNPDSPYLKELKWLLGPEGTISIRIIGRLREDDALRRKFAAAVAFQIARADSEALRYAASADDPEIAQFGGDMLERSRLS